MDYHKFLKKVSIILSTVVLLLQIGLQSASAYTVSSAVTNKDGISVDVKQIKELAGINFDPQQSTPSQALAQTIASLVSVDSFALSHGFSYNAKTVLKYLYPNDTDSQLQGATITPDQAVQWLHSIGYTATIVNRPLTTAEIKSYLDKSTPIVPILANQNAADWLSQTYAGILYAHDDVTAGSQTLHKSFIKSINYGEAMVQDGAEAQTITFPEQADSPDPIEQQSSYKWVSTIVDVKQDPSWSNANTIAANKKTGVFASKQTSSSGQTELDFTDPAITALVNKYPATSSDQATKLTAVSLINLYEDAAHQKTVADLDNYLKVSASVYITSQQIMNWYQSLGFDFDVIKGKAPMASTKAINDSGRLYLTIMKANESANPEKNTGVLGDGYLLTNSDGYRPKWQSVKASEILTPSYNTPLTNAGMTQYQTMAKTFAYSNIRMSYIPWKSGTPVYTYSEDATIYNIRAKGSPDSTEVSTPAAASSVKTTQTSSTVKAVTNANYYKAPNFMIRESQGQQPWCSAFVNAAAINDVNRLTSPTSDVSAQSIMQAIFPTDTPAVLANKTPGSISKILAVIQKKYGVTADIVNRSLTFAEVKAQIDAGNIVQMDAESQKIAATDGVVDHALSIVGYVLPTNSSGTPYYEVWNPWWNTIFYLSSSSPTFTLSGLTLTWNRTWYNWRKSTTIGKINGVSANVAQLQQAAQGIKPFINDTTLPVIPNPTVQGYKQQLLENLAVKKAILSSKSRQKFKQTNWLELNGIVNEERRTLAEQTIPSVRDQSVS